MVTKNVVQPMYSKVNSTRNVIITTHVNIYHKKACFIFFPPKLIAIRQCDREF